MKEGAPTRGAAPSRTRGAGARRTAWDAARSILAVRLDTLGDVLMTTPALRALRELEDTRVTLLTSPAGASVAEMVPVVDDVLVYEAPWMKHASGADAADLALVEQLRRRRFDAAVIFTVFSQSPLPAAMVCHLAGIPLSAAHCRENPYRLLTDWVRESEPEREIRHEVRRQLDLVEALGRRTGDERMSIAVPDGARSRVRALLSADGLALDTPWVVVHPGASAPSRRYPPERYADVAVRLAADGFSLVFTGSAAERDLVDDIRSAVSGRTWSLAGRSSLAELAAVIELAPVLLTNNTGPAHLAAAAGTPVVDLYALTNPQHTPWRVPSRVLFHDVPCRNCFSSVCREGHHGCLRGVPASRVASAVIELYDQTRASGGAALADGSRQALLPAGAEDPQPAPRGLAVGQ